MANKPEFDTLYLDNVLGASVPVEPVSRTLVAAAPSGYAVKKLPDGTLGLGDVASSFATGSVGCEIKAAATQSVANSTITTATLATTVRNDGGFSIASSQITIPAGRSGWYAITGATVWATSATGDRIIYIFVNNVMVESVSEPAGGTTRRRAGIAKVAYLNAGDVVDLRIWQNTGAALSTDVADYPSFLSLALMLGTDGTAYSGARVRHSANTTLTTGVVTTLPFNTEDWDTDGYHDNATNNSRLTAPIAGRYRVNASGFFAGAASGIYLLSFKVNGAGEQAGGVLPAQAFGGWVNISTDLNLAAGDYVEVVAYQTTGANCSFSTDGLANGRPSFVMERLGTGGVAAFDGVLVRHNADQTIAHNTSTLLAFNTEIKKTRTGYHDNATNNSRLTVVEAGDYEVWFLFSWDAGSTTNIRSGVLLKNGATVVYRSNTHPDAGGERPVNHLCVTVHDCVPGDYFQVQVYQNSGANRTIASNPAFQGTQPVFGLRRIASAA